MLAKPTSVQVAYGGYKSAIEAFVHATVVKKKTATALEAYPLPEDYIPSVPLPLPQLIVKLGSKITPTQVSKIMNSLKKENINPVDIGKGGPAFEILSPTWHTCFTKLPVVANPQCARIDYHGQVGDLQVLKPVYQFIDGFLATNTYPFKKEDFASSPEKPWEKSLGEIMEQRHHESLWRHGFGDKAPKKKRLAWSTKPESRKIDDQEEIDITPFSDTISAVVGNVYVAKPSPKPSSTSWGSPSQVPFVGGLVFPYFDGLLQYDLPGTRDLIGRYIFRCLGKSGINPKDAYKELRSCIGSVLNTPQGLILGHVLKGIELCLDSQTQLYLLFDSTEYLGFCLLGEEFSVWNHGKWVEAESAEDLRSVLRTITTSEQAVEELRVLLNKVPIAENEIRVDVTREDVENTSRLLNVLAGVNLPDDDEGKALEKEIIGLIGRCNLPSDYRAVTPENIVWAIEELTISAHQAIDPDESIYVPAGRWTDCHTKVYKVLAAFGPRSFSFRNGKGDEVKIQKVDPTQPYKFLDIDSNKNELYPFIVYNKAIFEAVRDWKSFVNTGKVKMDFNERAGGVRAHKFWGDRKVGILKALARGLKEGQIGGTAQKESTEMVRKPKKTGGDIAIDDASLDDLFK
jgi:hypothetical protein